MKLSFKKVLPAVFIIVAVCFIIFCIKNCTTALPFGIFGSIDELGALDKYAVPDASIPSDKNLKELVPAEKWKKKVSVDGAECIVRAYVFDSHDEAEAYYKRAANRSSANDGANASASAGGFGKASYVTMNEKNVLYVTGDNMKDIEKVVNAFFNEVPSALEPFVKDKAE